MHFFPPSCHFIPLRSKYSLCQPVLKQNHKCRNVYDMSALRQYRLDGQGFDSRQEQDIFLSSTASRQALGLSSLLFIGH
jgi:hypothetical protein